MKRKLYHLVLAVVALSSCGDDSAEPPHGETARTIELNARTEGPVSYTHLTLPTN